MKVVSRSAAPATGSSRENLVHYALSTLVTFSPLQVVATHLTLFRRRRRRQRSIFFRTLPCLFAFLPWRSSTTTTRCFFSATRLSYPTTKELRRDDGRDDQLITTTIVHHLGLEKKRKAKVTFDFISLKTTIAFFDSIDSAPPKKETY